MGRLLTGYYQNMHIFFIEKNGILIPNVESHEMTREQVKAKGEQLVGLIQKEYAKCAMEKMQKSIVATGLSANLSTNNDNGVITHILDVGNGKRFVVSVQGETICEEVEGVVGRSCVTSTKERSQYMNKQDALRKLGAILKRMEADRRGRNKNSAWREHTRIIRGNPTSTYVGMGFERKSGIQSMEHPYSLSTES